MWKEAVPLAAAVGAACVLRSGRGKKHLSVEAIEITSPKLEKDRNLAFLSDLHNNEFGRDSGELVATIHRSYSDAALSGGDMMVCKGKRDIKVPLKLSRRLTVNYPVYCGNGNHENRMVWERSLYGDLHEECRDATAAIGAHYLEDSFAFLGRDPRIVDPDLSPCFYWKVLYQKAPLAPEGYMERKLGKEPSVCKERSFTMFLVHSPLYSDSYIRWGADLTLVGHFYGGIIRIPGLGGATTPQHQFSSPWRAGGFEQSGERMIVSRGLGTHSINIRLNNRSQLVLIRLRRARQAQHHKMNTTDR